MAKVIGRIDNDQKEFVKVMEKLTYRFQTWEVWQDFVVMFATAISNAIDTAHKEKREEAYMRIVKKYNKEELDLFPKLCAIVVEALEVDRDRDFLGELYMALNLGNHWKGQFFTPYNVCKMMSKITGGNFAEQIKKDGYITVNDPACGAGALLIAYANSALESLSKQDMNFQNYILFTAQDIDMITGLMCYIQLSLLGCAGYVKIADTIINPMSDGEALSEFSKPESDYWYTPMYFSDIWQYRILFRSIDAIICNGHTKTDEIEVGQCDSEAKEAVVKFKSETYEQLSFF